MSGGFDMEALLEQARALQEQLLEARRSAAEQLVEGQAGGGAVKVRVTGGLEFESVSIDAGAVDPADPAMLEDLVLAACNDAVTQARALGEKALEGLDPGSLGLGDAAADDLEPGGPVGPH